MKGRLIVFEGPDGVGKSTLAAALARAMRDRGIIVTLMAFPGNEAGSLGAAVYTLHHDLKQSIGANAKQALHVAAHIDAIERTILPALLRDETVILDRYWWSTIVYGRVARADRKLLDHLIMAELESWGGVTPERIFLIDRDTPFRAENSKRDYMSLRGEYAKLAKSKIWRGLTSVVRNVDPVLEIVEQLTLALGEDRKFESRQNIQTSKQQALFTAEPSNAPRTFSSTFLRDIAPLKPSSVFASYWTLAAKRQDIYFQRLTGEVKEQVDPILQQYRFTNAYRAADRVSQYLIRHVAYQGSQSPEELFFRILLFKVFNKIETWQKMVEEFGTITAAQFNVGEYDRLLTRLRSSGSPTFSGAYIMPSRAGSLSSERKHRNYLDLIERMLRDGLPVRLSRTASLRESFELLRSYPLLGDFLAFQYTIDCNYSVLFNHNENEFVVTGPGARSGIRKCFLSTAGLSDAEVIRLVTEMQSQAFADLGLEFKTLWGRPLHLIDCQNLFCETDKYARLAHPEVQGIGERIRIKQHYRRNPEPVSVWFPPKWGLNERIASNLTSTL